MIISTTVEPSNVNMNQHSYVWFYIDGEKREEIASYIKYILPKTYFQFGSVTFPQYEGDSNYLVWNGRAVNRIDGKQ